MRRILPVLLLVACKTPAPASQLRTDETQAVLRDFCSRSPSEGNLDEIKQTLCECLDKRRAAGDESIPADVCDATGGLSRWMAHQRRTMEAAGVSAMTNTAGDALTSADRACLADMIELNMETRTGYLASMCDDGELTGRAARDLLTFPGAAPASRCWRLTRMDEAACMTAEPCDPTLPADLAGLPLAADDLAAYRAKHRSTLVPAGRDVSICHARIQAIHRLKDPDDAERPYNLAFANLLGFGRSAPQRSFQAANCHGTAQAVVGGFLDALPVTEMIYNGPYVERDCKALAEPAFAAVQQAAQAAGRTPRAADYPIADGGHVINMVHDDACDPSDTGNPKFYVGSCEEGRLRAHIQYYGMCINRWKNLLAGAGLTELPANASWTELKPGCVMTANDHSISLVMQNDLWCYYYEATTPYGPPLLRVESCPMLHQRFPRRYCPAAPMTFALKGAG
jgi:hypothetical protein